MPRASFSQAEAALFFRHATRVVRHADFDILIMRHDNPEPRLLVVTPRRVGNAPERNRVRRRIKAIFHELQPLHQSYNCAVVVKRPAISLSFSELAAHITSALAPYVL